MQMADEKEYRGKKPIQTSTRWGKVASIFSPRADKELHASIASLCVLFEDLRIEMLGQSEKDLGRLGQTGHVRQAFRKCLINAS